jgi:hypothetical protein
MMFMDDSRWSADETRARELFWDDLADAFAEQSDEYVCETSEGAFRFWYFFDYLLHDGRRLVEHFLEDGPSLSGGEYRYLEHAARISMKLYEVVDVVPGSSLTLRDVITGADVTVREHLGSQSITRWELITARVIAVGGSGEPEMDGAVLGIPALVRQTLIDQLRTGLKEHQLSRRQASDREYFKSCAPLLHTAWLRCFLQPVIPEMETSSGEEMVLSRSRFDVEDREQLQAALEAEDSFLRCGNGLVWNWVQADADLTYPLILGELELEPGKLWLKALSRERAEKGRSLIERIAGDAVRFRATSFQVPEQVLADMQTGDPGEPQQVSTEQTELLLEYYEHHYRSWIDEEVPALGGLTPRQASQSDTGKPRLAEMIKDLERMYQKALKEGQPAYDPSWMWAELGLDRERLLAVRHSRPLLTGFESIQRCLPGIEEAAIRIATEERRRPGFDPETVLDSAQLSDKLEFLRFVKDEARMAHRDGIDREAAAHHGDIVGAYLELMCNYELHRRKTFWVDESLAWMLGRTDLDVSGELLRPPFASFAFVFTDRYTLGLAERLIAADTKAELRGRILEIATAYVTRLPASGDCSGLRLSFTFDALTGEWPYLLVRDLHIKPDAQLAAILESHYPDVDPDILDPVFTGSVAKRLVHLIINAILYATSAGVDPQPGGSPVPGRARGGKSPLLASSEVFYLPGKIEISHVRELQRLERAPSGKKLMHRFMVRGHWRRANPSWKDQRPRWIKPYWKGPDLATVIERAYRMKE